MKRLGVAAALLLSPASAADAPELLPPWVVTETPLRPEASPVRANALVPAEAWSGRAVATLADAFRLIPGAILQESFGGFEPPRISIRGSGVQSAPSSRGVALLLNELPLGLADGSFNSALVDPLLGNRLEVQRGLDGWRTAPTTLGGAIDFRREPPASAGTAVRLEAGSAGAVRARTEFAAIHDATRATVAVAHARQDGFRDHSGQDRSIVATELDRMIGQQRRAAVEFYHARVHYDVPGPLTLATALAAPASVTADVRRDQPSRTAALTRVSTTVSEFATTWEWRGGLAYGNTTDDFRQLQALGLSRSHSDDLSAQFEVARRTTWAGLPQQWRVGATAAQGWRDVRRLRNDAGADGPPFGSDRLIPRTITATVEDSIAIGSRAVATLGCVRAASRRDIDDRGGSGATRLRAAWQATLPQASLRWKMSPRTNAFVAWSASAEPPTFDDLVAVTGSYPNLSRRVLPLGQQRTTTVEVGLRGARGPIAWDLAVYQADWHSEILRLTDARGVALGAVNAAATLHRGIETSFRWRLLEQPVRLSLQGTAVWTQFVFDDDPVFGRNRLAGNPPHLGNAELVAEHPHGYFAAVGVDWTAGHALADHAGLLAYGGRSLFSARAGWRSRTWTIFAELRNALDRRTIASTAGVLDRARNPAATAIFLPAPGRNFTVGVEWRH